MYLQKYSPGRKDKSVTIWINNSVNNGQKWIRNGQGSVQTEQSTHEQIIISDQSEFNISGDEAVWT